MHGGVARRDGRTRPPGLTLAEAAAPSPGRWRSATIADATGLAGFRPRTIEGLEVVEVAIDMAAEGFDGPVVRVTQMLTTIERTVVGDVHVVAIARVEPETLRRLLADVR